MKVKKTVATQQPYNPALFWAIGIAQMVYADHGEKLVVTSLNDGKHMKNSLHYSGRAADLRTRGVSHQNQCNIRDNLKAVLGPRGFDVLLEAGHLHIEWQHVTKFFEVVD